MLLLADPVHADRPVQPMRLHAIYRRSEALRSIQVARHSSQPKQNAAKENFLKKTGQ